MDFNPIASRFARVPEEKKPLYLYHCAYAPQIVQEAQSQGWTVVDVRLMPNKTDDDRRECVKAWLEGMRVGTIEVDIKRLKAIELEAKILGMVGQKPRESDSGMTDDDVNRYLDLGSHT